MDHLGGHEGKGPLAGNDCFAITDGLDMSLKIREEVLKEVSGHRTHDKGSFWVTEDKVFDRRRVVWLHMVDDEIVEGTTRKEVLNVLKENLGDG